MLFIDKQESKYNGFIFSKIKGTIKKIECPHCKKKKNYDLMEIKPTKNIVKYSEFDRILMFKCDLCGYNVINPIQIKNPEEYDKDKMKIFYTCPRCNELSM